MKGEELIFFAFFVFYISMIAQHGLIRKKAIHKLSTTCWKLTENPW